MATYNPDRQPDPNAWLALDESERIEIVVKYHRRHAPLTPRVRLHATFHTIIENQVASNEAVVVETLARLQEEGLSRHDAIHAIGSVLAVQLHDLLKQDGRVGSDPNETYAVELRHLTARSWRNAG